MIHARGLLLLTLTSFLALAAWAAPRGLAGDQADVQEVKRLYDRWIQAFEKRDLDDLMSCYDNDVVFSMQGQPNANHAEIRAGFAADFKTYSNGPTWLPHIEQIYADGALVVVVARWESVHKSPTGQVEVQYRIRSVDILTPTPGGLKIVHTVNYPLDPPR
jgi:uncharacterized protein (TIGR02246 family)